MTAEQAAIELQKAMQAFEEAPDFRSKVNASMAAIRAAAALGENVGPSIHNFLREMLEQDPEVMEAVQRMYSKKRQKLACQKRVSQGLWRHGRVADGGRFYGYAMTHLDQDGM